METRAPDEDPAAYETVPVPHWKRITGAATILAAGAVIFLIALLGSSGQHWMLACGVLAGSSWLAWKTYTEVETKELAREDGVLTDAAAAELARIQALKERRQETTIAAVDEKTLWESRWFIRYPIAGLIMWGAVVLGEQHHPWFAGGAVLLAATVAYELAALLVLLGVGYLLFQGVAALPVSVAVVVGAIIIASAIRKR